MTNKNQEQSLVVKNKKTGDSVLARVQELESKGDLAHPADYSAENAIKAAMLQIQEIKGPKKRNYQPVIEYVTSSSIANALLSMVIQGLNPDKKQGYFIAYDDQLTFQTSYFGNMAITKRVTGAKEINASVIYEGDEVDYEMKHGKIINLTHKSKFGNINKDKIIGAYAVISFEDSTEDYTEVMTFDEIEQAWKQSRNIYNGDIKADSVHRKFAQEMAKKTVINRACKKLLNSSNDASLVTRNFQENEERNRRVVYEAEIEEEQGNTQIDFDETTPEEVEFKEVPDNVSEETGEILEVPVNEKSSVMDQFETVDRKDDAPY